MEKDTFKTKVIFRKFKDDGEIIAIFPEIPGDNSVFTCQSYQHVGQHGQANELLFEDDEFTLLAKPKEYQDLLDELKSIGYNLKVVEKYTDDMFWNRQENLNKMRGEQK